MASGRRGYGPKRLRGVGFRIWEYVFWLQEIAESFPGWCLGFGSSYLAPVDFGSSVLSSGEFGFSALASGCFGSSVLASVFYCTIWAGGFIMQGGEACELPAGTLPALFPQKEGMGLGLVFRVEVLGVRLCD